MRVTTVGTGTAAPTKGRVQSGHLIDAGPVRLLLDCGSGVATRLADIGAPWQEITHVAVTHFHADHVVDIPTLLYAWRYGQLPPRSRGISIIGPVVTLRPLASFAVVFGSGLLELGFPSSVTEVAPGERVSLGDGVEIGCHKVPHTGESVAYSIERGGRRIVYTGDTAYDPMLAEWARGTDVLLCECSLPVAMAIPTHMTPEQCGALAAAALPRHLVLTHFYPPVERVDIRALVAAHYAGPVTLADDGSTFEIEED